MNTLLIAGETRRDSYKLLSECYYVPSADLLELLSGVEGSQSRLHAEIAAIIPAANEIESLQIDFARLFVGPFELLAPPYGSVYLEGTRKVMGNSTMDVIRRYGEEGLDIVLAETPDHIAMELEFMYFLIFKEIESLQRDDIVRANNYLAKQKAFLETHLGTWVSQFAGAVEANARTAFYTHLAQLTRSFVIEDLERIASRPHYRVPDGNALQ